MSLYIQKTGNGPDLVMIHGWGMHGGVWDPVIEALSGAFRLHLVDLPGLGNSSVIDPYTLSSLSAAIAEAVPARVAVCGWSLGGQVALRWAMDMPDQINRMVLVGTTPKFVNDDRWNLGTDADVLQQFAIQVRDDYQNTLTKFLALQAHGGDAPKETIRRLREQFFMRREPAPHALQDGLDILLTTDLRDALAAVQMPTLVLHGDYDRLAPVAAGQWLADHLPHSSLKVCKGASHAPFISHPEWFVDRMKAFLHG